MLLERHGALPPDVEAGLLLGAHAAFEAGGAADALDVLVQLAAVAARAWAAAGEWRPLVHLVAGARQASPQATWFSHNYNLYSHQG